MSTEASAEPQETTTYQGERYLTLDELYTRYEELARAHPEWVKLERVGGDPGGQRDPPAHPERAPR